MDIDSIVRALATLFGILLVGTIGGVFLTALLVRVEPMLLPTITSYDMLIEYIKWRHMLAAIYHWTIVGMSVLMVYLLLLGGIRVASNIWAVRRDIQ